jgi:demethylmenaquinone methyltransferase/2-methoxy-6-polyprenyl-1,4-benzoquinol methylase
MNARHPKGYWYLPGLLYDLAFKRMFRGLRRRVARTIEREGLYPWLEVCCGTGDQLRHARGHVPRGSGLPQRAVPEVRVPGPAPELTDDLALGLDLSFGFVRYARARAPHVPFVCGDAARLPFKTGSMRAVSVSFGLHDKSLELRSAILAEAKRVLKPGGRLIAVDFENPWDAASRAGALFTRAIERFAGREHYGNGRDFLRRGGLRGFLRENGFAEVARRDVPVGSVSVVVAKLAADSPCDLPPAE